MSGEFARPGDRTYIEGRLNPAAVERQIRALLENRTMANTTPSPILRYFEYTHLPTELQDISAACSNLASYLETRLPAGAEKSTALRKLLECKDAAVRAALPPK